MPFQKPKNTSGCMRPAAQDKPKPIKPKTIKPTRGQQLKSQTRASKRMIMPGKAGGR